MLAPQDIGVVKNHVALLGQEYGWSPRHGESKVARRMGGAVAAPDRPLSPWQTAPAVSVRSTAHHRMQSEQESSVLEKSPGP